MLWTQKTPDVSKNDEFVLKTRNFVFKTMNFVLIMMNFAGEDHNHQGDIARRARPEP